MSEKDERIGELEAERDRLWKETLSLKRECEQHMRARNVLTTEKQELEHLLERKEDRTWGALSEQIGNLKAERDKLAAKRDEYWKEVVRLNVAYEDLEVERDELRRELDDARSYIEHLETAGDVTRCDEIEAARDKVWHEMLRLRDERDKLHDYLTKREDECNELRQKLEERDEHWYSQGLEVGTDAMQKQVEWLEAERDELQNDLALLVQERDLLEDELTLLEEQRDESRKKLVHTVNPGGKFNEKMRAAIVDALWDEGGAFDQLSDAVKAAVLGDEQCECETCECKASEQEEAAPFKWDMESGTGSSVANWQDVLAHPYEYPVATPSEAGRMAQTREARVWREATGRIKEAYAKWQRSRTTERKQQFTYHMWRMQQPREVLWAGMPHSPLNPRPHTLSKGCWCNPTAEDYREAQ